MAVPAPGNDRLDRAPIFEDPVLHAQLCVEMMGGERYASGWIARCPAHDAQSHSLNLTIEDRLRLAHCEAGCTQEYAIAVMQQHSLWPSLPAAPSDDRSSPSPALPARSNLCRPCGARRCLAGRRSL
jgi:hypothetical protein